MGTCYRCGIEISEISDFLTGEGIVGLCGNCVDEDDLPITKPSESAFFESGEKRSVRERLSASAGINPQNHRNFEERDSMKKEPEKELVEFVRHNVHASSEKPISDSFLVRNFHWIIMRARRSKKLTLDEVSSKIAEPKELLELIERGHVSEKNISVLKKLELFLGISVFTKEAREKIEFSSKKISFDPVTSKSLTIEDLKKMAKKF
jgi:ribosome-binding protein aMBF1 (putative translation factor)